MIMIVNSIINIAGPFGAVLTLLTIFIILWDRSNELLPVLSIVALALILFSLLPPLTPT